MQDATRSKQFKTRLTVAFQVVLSIHLFFVCLSLLYFFIFYGVDKYMKVVMIRKRKKIRSSIGLDETANAYKKLFSEKKKSGEEVHIKIASLRSASHF
jgi:hypothetical protein